MPTNLPLRACKKCWWRNNLQWAVLLGMFVLIFGGRYEVILQTSVIFVLVVGFPWFFLKHLHPPHVR